jgi:hypothetical protein
MGVPSFEYAKALKAAGERLGREGLSKRVLALVADFDGSYKGAMILAGRMKAIAQAASSDGYWTEKVDDGFHKERIALTARL